MITRLFMTATLLLSSFVNSAPFTSEDFSSNVYLDEGEVVHLLFTLLNNTHIEIGVICNNPGWCSIGISPNGQMPDSDILFFWVDDNNGNVYLQDRYAESRSIPLLDVNQNDLTLISGVQEDDITYIRFIRKIYMCDDDDVSFTTGTSRILYAFNENDPTEIEFDSDNNGVEWHGSNNMGSKSVNVLSYSEIDVELEENAMYVDLRVDNHTLETYSDTIYYCTLLSLPRKNKTHHIVEIDPLIQQGNEGVVHHIVLYHCPPSYVTPDQVGISMDCSDYAEMPSGDCQGFSPIYAWAVGGESYKLPANVGIEMGGDLDDENTIQYILVEIHYDNPQLLSNISDNSGMRIWYTSDLRNESSSYLWTGIAHDESTLYIPPGMPYVKTYGFCGSECINSVLPENGVTIISSFLHAHTTAIAIKGSIIRNGVEVAIIEENENYDFDYQATTYLSEPLQLFPNDSIRVECIYNTEDRTFVTYGGFSSLEEMCFIGLQVYPKIELTECFDFLWPCDDTDCNEYNDYYDFLVNAYFEGYVDDDFFWIGTSSEAVDYYNQLWTDDKYLKTRGQWCLDKTFDSAFTGDDVNNDTFPFPYYTYEAVNVTQWYEYPDYCVNLNNSDINLNLISTTTTTTTTTTMVNNNNNNNNSNNGGEYVKYVLIIGISVFVCAVLMIGGACYMYQKKKNNSLLIRNQSKGNENVENVENVDVIITQK